MSAFLPCKGGKLRHETIYCPPWTTQMEVGRKSSPPLPYPAAVVPQGHTSHVVIIFIHSPIIQPIAKGICEACCITLAISSTQGSRSRAPPPSVPLQEPPPNLLLSGWVQKLPLPMSPLLPINPGKGIFIPILPKINNFVCGHTSSPALAAGAWLLCF